MHGPIKTDQWTKRSGDDDVLGPALHSSYARAIFDTSTASVHSSISHLPSKDIS